MSLRFPVRPARLWDRAFLTTLLLAMGVLWLAWPLYQRLVPVSPGMVSAVRLLAAAVCGFVVSYLLTRPLRRPGDAVTLSDEALTLPPALTGGAQVTVRVDEIRRVELQGVENELRLVLATGYGRQAIAANRMATVEDFLELLDAVLALAARVPPPERLRLRANVEAALRAPPAPRALVTAALIGACLAFGAWAAFGVQPVTGEGIERQALALGANQPTLVREGQWFRLVSANYLHGGMAHLLMNMLGLWNIGQALERMLGRRALLTVYLAAGLTGALASSAFVELRWSVGASTSLFGLMGALAVVHFRGRHHTPAHLLPSGDFWRNTVFINALLVIAAPNIDHLGHLGGLAGGALTALLLDVRPYRREARPQRRLTIAAALLTAIHAAGLTVALTRPPEARRADLARHQELARAERGR